MTGSALITGIGMVSSLGLTAQTSCAAARAGMSRARELDYFTQWSPVDGSISPVVGHQIPMITAGFEGDARLARMLGGAVLDLTKQLSSLPWDSEELRWYLALPDPFRESRGGERVLDPQDREELLAAEENLPQDNFGMQSAQQLLRMMCIHQRLPQPVNPPHISRAGNCGFADCARQALADVAEKRIRYAIVAAADSLLDESTLNWLAKTSRLKSPALAAGLAPGEASVVVCLQAGDGFAGNGRKAIPSLLEVREAREESSFYSGQPVQGQALTDIVQNIAGDGSNWFVTDLNGEEYRAMEWGYVLVRTKLEHYALTYPAVSFGDTGAASGGVAVAVVRHAMQRGCAPSRRAVVLSTSDDTLRTSMVLEPTG